LISTTSDASRRWITASTSLHVGGHQRPRCATARRIGGAVLGMRVEGGTARL
jgi:hypothetical protein